MATCKIYRKMFSAALLGVAMTAQSPAQFGQLDDPFSSGARKETQGMSDILQYRQDLKKKELSEIAGKTVPLDAPVNPEEYYVGPGDVLALNVWSSSPVSIQLPVMPEGTLLIPNVGPVSTTDLTLAGLKEKVIELASRKYPGSSITLTLVTPRKISVRIIGSVLTEGDHEVESVHRVSSLIAKANEPPAGRASREEDIRLQPVVRSNASDRRILARHRDGSSDRVDLVKYDATRRGRYNPYLREGDVVLIPPRRGGVNDIGIYGGVKKFGGFEFLEGDSLLDLVAMGYGLKPEADSARVQFSRLSLDGASMVSTTIDLKAAIERRSENILLRPGDRLFVPERRDARRDFYVVLEGEVAQPGHYPISSKGTKLSDLIRMGGGFTKDAYLPGAIVFRLPAAETELSKELLSSARYSPSEPDSFYFASETLLRLHGEPVPADFHRLFVLGDSTQDVTLLTYDRIVVPSRRGTVYVFGQVVGPGHIRLEEGRSHAYYIEKAGGFAPDAREGDIKIIKATTRSWLDPDKTSIEDGDYIWVPKEIHYPPSYYLMQYAQIASIVGVVATVAILVITINK